MCYHPRGHMRQWRSRQGRALYFIKIPFTSPSASTPPPALCPGRLTITAGSSWVQTMLNIPGERAERGRDWDVSAFWTTPGGLPQSGGILGPRVRPSQPAVFLDSMTTPPFASSDLGVMIVSFVSRLCACMLSLFSRV